MVKYFAFETIAVGLKKGFKTEKRDRPSRPARRKGKVGKAVLAVRSVIRDTVGFAPYERRIQELIKLGNQKRALKFSKKRLGTHKRAKNKRAAMEKALQQA